MNIHLSYLFSNFHYFYCFIFGVHVNAVKFNEYLSVVVSAGYDQSLRAWDCESHNTEPIQVYIYFSVSSFFMAALY